jgi:tRNA(Ile)-lysidine synthase
MARPLLVREVEAALGAQGARDGGLLVAVSGGVDSVVLAHALAELRERTGLALVIGHVNHGLRGADSEADHASVEALGAKLGVAVAARRADPTPLRAAGSSRDRPTLQEAARRLRYEALYEMADAAGARWIATAHTADDQAETLLLRLLRGSGPDGLGGIPERSPDGRILRPLLGVCREEVLAHATREGIGWREDASNEHDAYARNRLRRHWLPGLAGEFNPRLLRSLADLAEALRRDAEWIDAQVAREAARRFHEEPGCLWIERTDWAELPEALARRQARLALRSAGRGRDTTRVHLTRMLAFFRDGRPGTAIELPGGLELAREGDRFRLGASRDT